MTYTIVFKRGTIKRLLGIVNIYVLDDNIVFETKTDKIYTYPRLRIASVVFYP